MNEALLDKLRTIAAAPVLLVASDYDGTLSPLVDDFGHALPHGPSIAALAELATLGHTHAAIVSGRARESVTELSGAPKGVCIVGSHGAEDDEHTVPRPPAEQLEALALQLEAIAGRARGLLVERKPFGAALHYRAASKADGNIAVTAVLDGPARQPGVFVRHGSRVVELCVTSADKGSAVVRHRFSTGARAVVFIGDDLTDEEVFKTLGPSDLGIHVGTIDSAATARIAEIAEVGEVLERLIEFRRAWLAGRGLPALERHSILSDQRTVAVIDERGSVVWCCLPRVDSPSLFGSLLGGPAAGLWEIADVEQHTPRAQRYDGDSMMLVTEWGSVRVTDYLDCSGGRPYQRAGRSDLVRVVEGRGRVCVGFSPRWDFGRVPTKLKVHENGLEVEGSPDPLVLYSRGVTWRIWNEGQHQTAEATVEVSGEPVVMELRSGSANLRPSVVAEDSRRAQTRSFWDGWAESLRLPALHQDVVKRSSLVLKALSHGPTGAMIAAATTSLPEQLGGVRNWDYRYCWPRDACLAASSLVRLGNTGHALKLLDWLLGIVDAAETPDRLRPIYTVTGKFLPPEAEIGHLAGYGESRPVRISNGAANQVQLDVFGPIVDLVAILAERGAPLSPDHWRLVRAMVQAVEARWREPDHGIWEIRAERRHHVHSRVMCWMTVDRALRVEEHVMGRRDAGWERLRDAIREDVLANGWSEKRSAFTAAYGSETVDAATLWIGLSGLLAPTDERFVRTVEAVDRTLRRGPVVMRYCEHDGLPGVEGGMLICAGWLAESLHLIGRTAEARQLLDGLVGLLGPTGIAAEQYCPRHKIALGNIAQAYSHLAIINAAVAIGAEIAAG